MSEFNVGIISQTLVQQHHLRHIVEECNYRVASAWLVNQLLDDLSLLSQHTQQIDLWLIDVDIFGLDQTKNTMLFERWLFDLKQPVIFGEGSTYNAIEEGFNSWVRQLKMKLLSVSGKLTASQPTREKADYVWVLAASTGGPEAVKQFLDRIPAGLGITFLYAQHIESGQHRSLANIVSRDSQYTGSVATNGATLESDSLIVVPAAHEIDFMPDSTLLFYQDRPWRGKYTPSIDSVTALVAKHYGARGGVIFFSGMGDDGVVGARLMSRRKGKVWIQAPPTCASADMPQAVHKTGCVTAVGTPEQLAAYLEQAVKSFSDAMLTV